MRKFCFVLVLVCFFVRIAAQAQTMAGGLNSKGMDIETSQSGMGVVQEVDNSEKRVIGSAYLFDTFRECRVYSGGKEVMVALNFNIEKRQYEFKEGSAIKLYPMSSVDKFIDIDNAVYQPFNKYQTVDGIPLEGIARQTTAYSKCNLLTFFDVLVREGNYVQAMDVGQKNTTVKKREHYFLLIHGAVYKVYPSAKKTVAGLPFNNELRQDIQAYIKESGISLKSEAGASLLAEYINTK
jgi:hypothetical protein